MTRLAEWVFRIGYRTHRFEPLRDDFIRWYATAYDLPEIKQAFADIDVSKLAYRTGRSAKEFDPDNLVIEAFDAVDMILEVVSTWFNYLKVIGAAFALLSASTYTVVQSLLLSLPIAGIAGLFLAPPALFYVLNHWVQSNVELVRLFNEQLAKVDKENWTERRQQYRVAFFLWNRSLHKPRTISVLVLLAVVRALSPRMYGNISEYIHENLIEYHEKGVWEVSKRELRRVWNQNSSLIADDDI